MPPTTPYSNDLGNREPIAAMRESLNRFATLITGWSPAQFERTYAPGKWSARLLIAHLAQTELALGNRARMALTVPNYAAQSFDQDRWVAIESAISGHDATEAFLALMRFNISLFASLSDADRGVQLSHPEYGALTVDWIVHLLAGHEIHHLHHLEQIATTPVSTATAHTSGPA